MTRKEALDYLASCLNAKLADRYDDDEQLRTAIHVVMPNFEYPDWSHRPIKSLYNIAGRDCDYLP